jgi:hypothetical protein
VKVFVARSSTNQFLRGHLCDVMCSKRNAGKRFGSNYPRQNFGMLVGFLFGGIPDRENRLVCVQQQRPGSFHGE